MPEQGKQIALVLIVVFGLVSIGSLAVVSYGAITPAELQEVFAGIKGLAEVFGIGMILAFFLGSRGQTSVSA